MSFTNGVLSEIEQIGSGELNEVGANNKTTYDRFEDGLVEGRFVQVKAGICSNMDGTVTPLNVGVSLRQITGEIGETTYTNTGDIRDPHANVADLGRVTIDVKAGETPAFGGAVSFENVAGVDAGKALAVGGVAVANATFIKEIKTNVWQITLKSFMV